MNGEKPFFDTNVLICATASDDPKAEIARSLILGGGVISVQILNEFVSVARRKLAMSWSEVSETMADFQGLFPDPRPITVDTHREALMIAQDYEFHIYDAIVISAALQASCDILYSEDMQDGQVIKGITIRNPFRSAVPTSIQP